MIEAANTSETSINFYETTRRYIAEDGLLHPRRNVPEDSYHLSALTSSFPRFRYASLATQRTGG
jgi:hypothetical protein